MNKQLLLTAFAVLSFVLAAGCSDVSTELKTPRYKTGLAEKEISNAAFGKVFPQQYASYRKNDESSVMTVYKGSVPFMKNDNVNPLPEGYKYAQPYLKSLWLGYPFSYEYREARGHTHALEDILHIDRINRYSEQGGLPSTCWSCKTTKMEEWVAANGDKFWSMNFNSFRDKFDAKDHSIGCANCHNPSNMELKFYSVPLKEWLKRAGKDESTLTRNEKRSLVCAQCHSEYYFTHPSQGPAAKPIFPWDKGFNPADMYEYYKTHGKDNGPYVDWVHAVSKTPMIKMQHPEYEAWIDGTHGAAGVSCADCHMPYQRAGDKKKMSGHWWTSPLKDPEMRACRQCHADKSADYLKGRVLYTQQKTFDQLLTAQEMSVKAHEAVRQAEAFSGDKAPNYAELIAGARELIRKGQLYWDYVSAENSVGFHNPSKLLDTLASSIMYSRDAVDLACRATRYGISPALAEDIKTLVPPILKHSRKLQQDPAHLASNVWLKSLPLLPPAELVWDGQKKTGAK
jgi:nitrite reductase (cytochrome c-552)